MRISEDKIQEINEAVDIVDLVNSYGIKLQKAGKGYKGLCPFHEDTNPSFHVSLEKKIAKCMSCGEGGLPITFVSKIENIGFMDAARKLADRYHVFLDNEGIDKFQDKNKKYYDLMDIARQFYEFFLERSKNKEKALGYLHSRRLNDETIKRFHIGLAPSKSDGLTEFLLGKGFKIEDLEIVGLSRTINKKGFDVFKDRIMFPIFDEQNRCVGFSGRIYLDSSKDEPKYINSQETIIFKKSFLLYNLNNAKKEIKKKNRLVVFEGFMDVISAYNAGITEGVCSMGTALTKEHAAIIKRNTDNVIICYDGDKPGIKATGKAIDVLVHSKLNIKTLTLKDELDPDEYIKAYGNESFLRLFDEELEDAIDYLYNSYKRGLDLNKHGDIEEFKKLVFPFIKNLNSNSSREKYLSLVSHDTGISLQSIILDYDSYYNPNSIRKNVEISKPLKNNQNLAESKYDKAEKMLILHMMESRNRAYQIEYMLDDAKFLKKENYQIHFQLIDGYYLTHDEFNIDEFLKSLDACLKNYFLNSFENLHISKNNLIIEKEIKDLIDTVKKANDNKKVEGLKRRALEALTNEEKNVYYEKHLEELKVLKNIKN